MKATWYSVDGENALAFIPESPEELALLLGQTHETFCPDCEQATEHDTETCPHCGEGIGTEPEYRSVRKKN